ncbi:metalloprotease family protein [Infirmifilum sp. NZ]|uniref:metalloprotease family protein n=1 Tax=Infirmifilum sp. NZ TaxID=2926850 RepID=UPI0027A972C9|nr:metalloprotease family protein [Infirmifilum sp. NZ]UNQ73420.1 metalloprotease family protein [Infirmifilum sp. NZ]
MDNGYAFTFDALRHKRELTSHFFALSFLWGAVAGSITLNGASLAWMAAGLLLGGLLHELAHVAALWLMGVRGIELGLIRSKWIVGIYVKSPAELDFARVAVTVLAPLALTPLWAVAAGASEGALRDVFWFAGFWNTAGLCGDLLLLLAAASVREARVADRGHAIEVRGCCPRHQPLLLAVFIDYTVWSFLAVAVALVVAAPVLGSLDVGPLTLVKLNAEWKGGVMQSASVEFGPGAVLLALAASLALTALNWKRKVLAMMRA